MSSASRRNSVCKFPCLGFLPSPPGRPSGSPGVGVFPFALEVTIRTGLHLTTFALSRGSFACTFDLAQVRFALKSGDALGQLLTGLAWRPSNRQS